MDSDVAKGLIAGVQNKCTYLRDVVDLTDHPPHFKTFLLTTITAVEHYLVSKLKESTNG